MEWNLKTEENLNITNTKAMRKLETQEKVVFSYLQLLYLKSKDLTPISEVSLENATKIYGLSRHINDILFDKGVLIKTEDGKFSWGNWECDFNTSKIMTHNYVNHEKAVEKRHAKRKNTRYTKEEIRFILANEGKMSATEIGNALGRTKDAIYAAKAEVRRGSFGHFGFAIAKNGKWIIPAEKEGQTSKQGQKKKLEEAPQECMPPRRNVKWTNEEIKFLRENWDSPTYKIAQELQRTDSAIVAAKYAILSGDLSESEDREKVKIIPEKRYEVNTEKTQQNKSQPRAAQRKKLSILWGLISWEAST